MPLRENLKKVLIIGSGPIIIGQAAEFDYSGTQACEAIKKEGIQTVLVNSNPATIMTDKNIADKTYIEPLTVESLEAIIGREKPDGVLAGFGGQTALNLAMELNEIGVFKKYNVELLGIKTESIKNAEDRESFKNLMNEIDEPIAVSEIATNLEECKKFLNKVSLPIIIRPAYTLGGTGGGIASTYEEYMEICENGLEESPINQILLEQSLAGWKELEYEIMRDKKDNCMVVCNMENLDPVGIHTGDSIVVAPSQTLNDREYQMLRRSAIKIIRTLKIEGGCNIQFALDPNSNRYMVIEVNPRVSRSSALASKAAGYPIAKIAAKIALGYTLDELKNYVTGNSSALFEPALDYCVVKMPKWPFDKFKTANRTLKTQMKATGEVMAIDRSFESALLKAVISLEGKIIGLKLDKLENMSKDEIIEKINNQDDERLFALAEALRKGMTIDELHELTKIDEWFLGGIENIVNMENELTSNVPNVETIQKAEIMGFTDEYICKLIGMKLEDLKKLREVNGIKSVYKMVDTCSGEFEAKTSYYYSCYDLESDNVVSNNKKILVIGSGPIRIGQGIEFDYCCVNGVWAIKKAGYEAIIINNNPETVSTDFDISDKLYFEPLYIDDVMNVINEEKVDGVIVQFGGQTALNLSKKLNDRGVNLLGTSFESIDLAEDREKFRVLLKELDINSPVGGSVTSLEEADNLVAEIGYPVIVRPSYVIGGRAMKVVYNYEELCKYLKDAVNLSKEHPVLVDKYIVGKEIEVDAISDGEDLIIPGIMEHIEKTGVHSGDSIAVYPASDLPENVLKKIEDYTVKIAKKLNVKGLLNVQYAFDGDKVYVIEVNPRASRTVPILSKVTNIPMVEIAVEVMLGKKIKDFHYKQDMYKYSNIYAVKMPIFSNKKLSGVDVALGPEMKSTGEVLGVDFDKDKAIYKAFKASGVKILQEGNLYASVNDIDKKTSLNVIKKYGELGFSISASSGTYKFLSENGVKCSELDLDTAVEYIKDKKIDVVINTATQGYNTTRQGFILRHTALAHDKIVFTCLDTANAYINAILTEKNKENIEYRTMGEYLQEPAIRS
ncbi:carbamoyl-phosphate synthase (glutamine-hydrolyzing) large subunit [Clostridium autoethanogenum]|uniref:Carbamoyl phosphate synthase large chain n=2 Tax=Clostridium autoethanogenum TaxID=84023 RepID=A0A3M0S161_9CLOT|nr:carbamoyl-phosphate synthase (glutamine-hydrolyzing) large subunit [Clostridium autoethanogenum]AGY74818.1 carbamoyl-phosphate synthase (glutamine-hydrolyzing) large subunit [Clostridium autoethanogenum DSM 10061]ALU34996.1 Carbamoyl-phosphate synthase large subunit glutamine-dependent [Clostridium autoethanogenum DSM 10061]OVY51614.1 Carbamoyl-phosphate synthase large chain [Clostridium autoethanogenum]RMC92158.1 carbamoyl-phosphate synthase (glutamine-hydrolyzing) large subunit [Clostridiu